MIHSTIMSLFELLVSYSPLSLFIKERIVRIREFVTRFTRFSLEIRKTILFSFRVFSKKSEKRINKKKTGGSISRTLETTTTGTPVDTLRAFVEFCWPCIPCVHSLSFVGSRSRINPMVKYGG